VIQLTNKGNKGLGMVGKTYYYTFFTYCTSIGLLFDSLTKEKKLGRSFYLDTEVS
jgi:hypothetical protein